MALDICVLGSGSGGNSTLLRTPAGCLLIDAGFGPRATLQRMEATRVRLEQVRAIVLTHLDSDHFNRNWLLSIAAHGIRVFCHHPRRDVILSDARRGLTTQRAEKLKNLPELICGFDAAAFEPLRGVTFHPVKLAHDAEGSHGFLVSSGPARLGYATDLGQVPEELIELFCGVDVLALESNYDPYLQRNSSRPTPLKERIMGGSGHLSNEQAFAAVRAILDRTCQRHGTERLPRHIVLLHRSRECNRPVLVKRLFARDQRMANVLTLSDQFAPTGWLYAQKPAVQLSFLG